MDSQQHHRSPVTAQNLPAEVVERVLAHVPFRERVRAEGVCRAWRLHLSQRVLPLWQAASIGDGGVWDISEDAMSESDDDDAPNPPASTQAGLTEQKLQLFLPLQRWLWRHGAALQQLQCCTAFNTGAHGNPSVMETDDSLLAALLTTLAGAAPSLQALRLDTRAARTLADGSLVGIAGMGGRLRQLALLGLQQVSDASLLAALAQLPLLQDLAVLFEDGRAKGGRWVWAQQDEDEPDAPQPPDMMDLLHGISGSCTKLRTLAVGYLPRATGVQRWAAVPLTREPLPHSVSRLTALSCLALQNVGWEYDPDGLPHLPQLRRFSLRGNRGQHSKEEPRYIHQLSTLTRLEALQAALPEWPGRLPPGLTQLVLAPLTMSSKHARDHAQRGLPFIQTHLPPLRWLRHLALHGLSGVRRQFLEEVCAAAGALPQLISLHLVKCHLPIVPLELCELTQLQLLNLSFNELEKECYKTLARAPLYKLAACKQLDLRCHSHPNWDIEYLLQPETIQTIARMPALEQLALPPADAFNLTSAAAEMQAQLGIADCQVGSSCDPDNVEAQLAQHRAPGLPPIRVVMHMPDSDRWGALDVELPFAEVNDMLGVQLDRSIARGVPMNV